MKTACNRQCAHASSTLADCRLEQEVLERAAWLNDITVDQMKSLDPKERRSKYDDITVILVDLQNP